jgi:hypothetical protein
VRNYWFLFAMAALALSFPACAQKKPCPPIESNVKDAKYQVGQVWGYESRSKTNSPTLTIIEIDRLPKIGIVVHIRLDGVELNAPNGNILDHVDHMPFTKNAMLLSTTNLLHSSSSLPNLEGYEQWKEACGGVYTISVNDAVDVMQKTLTNGH